MSATTAIDRRGTLGEQLDPGALEAVRVAADQTSAAPIRAKDPAASRPRPEVGR